MSRQSTRSKMAQLLQQEALLDDELDSPILTGMVVVAEYVDAEGERMLFKLSSNRSGEALPHWTVVGFLQAGMGMIVEPPEDY